MILLASAAMVVSARNPVHSVLFLILAFFNAAALFLIAGAEFLAMILVIVYVGAVAVLFLFVVMMLDVDFAELRSGFQRYLPVGAAVGAVLLIELALISAAGSSRPSAAALRLSPAPADQQHRGARQRALYRLHLPVPGGRSGAAGRDDRRHRADLARPQDVAPSGHRRAERAHRGRDAGCWSISLGAGVPSERHLPPEAAGTRSAEPEHAEHGGPSATARTWIGGRADGVWQSASGIFWSSAASCWCSACSASS